METYDNFFDDDDVTGPTLTVSGEFLRLPHASSDIMMCQEGLKAVNEQKNRYSNVLPVDETRVKIKSPRGDYINASFIGLGSETKLIASQGPTKETEKDFWLMVCQYEVPVILMTTKLIEKQKRKCSKYWPEPRERCSYDQLEVETLCSDNLSDTITISRIRITQTFSFPVEDDACHQDNTSIVSHETIHIFYKGWPDFDVPAPSEMLFVLEILKRAWVDRSKPCICHCSAGIGRTGTIAAILRILMTGESATESVTKIRSQRHGMVQTKEQFKFIGDFMNYVRSVGAEITLL